MTSIPGPANIIKWVTLGSGIRHLAYGYTLDGLGSPVQRYEREIHNTWDLFILAAKNTEASHPAQDRLTNLVLRAKELGVLTRGDGNEECVTKDGRIWIDLPFMVLDFQDDWKRMLSPSASPSERCNFAAAIARFAGLGVLNDAFSACGLTVMCLALETPEDRDDRNQSMGFKLLPVVQMFLRYSGDKMLRLSIANHPSDASAWYRQDSSLSEGELARASGMESAGFSLERFRFWKTKLSALSLSLEGSDDEALWGVAGACSRNIDIVWSSFYGVPPDYRNQ